MYISKDHLKEVIFCFELTGYESTVPNAEDDIRINKCVDLLIELLTSDETNRIK